MGAACVGVAIGALIALCWPVLAKLEPGLLRSAAIIFTGALLIAPPWLRRLVWHEIANRVAVGERQRLGLPWVIDGDTIEDRADGVRYRLANIDAPETGDNAKCFRERELGEAAKSAAIKLVRTASDVAVRRTWRIDRYGRRVAFVLVDGRDLGELLVRHGLARPWRGRRRRWCGRNGGLAKIAKAQGAAFSCRTCREWR